MSESLTIGARVQVVDKGHSGTVAFVGTTDFAAGKWIGVILDEPKGKNNGTVQGKSYFECADDHGLFVRAIQLVLLGGGKNSPAPVKKSPQSRLEAPSNNNDGSKTSPPGGVQGKSRPHDFAYPANALNKLEVAVDAIDSSSGDFKPSPVQGSSNDHFKKPLPPTISNIPKPSRRYSMLPNSQSLAVSPIPESRQSNSITKRRSSISNSNTHSKSTLIKSRSIGNDLDGMDNHGEGSGGPNQSNEPHKKLETSKSQDLLMISPRITIGIKSTAPVKPPRKSLPQNPNPSKMHTYTAPSTPTGISDATFNFSTPIMNRSASSEDFSSSTFSATSTPKGSGRRSFIELGDQTPLHSGLNKGKRLSYLERLKYSANKICSRLPVAGSRGEPPKIEQQKSLQTTPSGSKSNLPSIGSKSGIPSKRSSFIETGFSETIVPQYTPGTPHLTTPQTPHTYSEDRFNAIQTVEAQKAEIKDLNEKLETLKIKRAADQEKLKECDRLRIQVEALIENKAKILESQAKLQRDLKNAKDEAREAIESKKRNAEETAELSETVEMATLDKEMAEEKAETLQSELDHANEQIAKMSTELETLREQCSTGRVVLDNGQETSLEAKQLRVENARLMDAIIKMRDASGNERYNHQKTQKELEALKLEVRELSIAKDRFESKCLELELQVADLQDQNDAALGAEEMVENLTEKNLDLEEKVMKLNEGMADLEALQDINDQLQESAKELEQELREELANSLHNIQYILREKEALTETLHDREGIILRFRELVKKIQEENSTLRRNLEEESSKSLPGLMEAQEFKKIFTESKAQTTAIDLELRKIEAKEAKLHAQFLNSFMPEGFFGKGGDNDALLVLLLIPRLINKSELLLNQVKKAQMSIGPSDGTTPTDGDRFNFSQTFCTLLSSLLNELKRWEGALNTCSAEDFLKTGILYPELSIQEKAIDFHLEFLRTNQLDENIPLAGFEKCLFTFQTFYSSHLGDGIIEHCNESPINVRAQAVKAELDQTRHLRIQLKDTEQKMNELRKSLRAKSDELGEAQIRKELAEKKMSTVSNQSEMKIENLTRKLEDVQVLLQRKEREFEATMEHISQDVESLGSENRELKEKLVTAYKRTLIESQARSSASTPIASPGGSFNPPPLSTSGSTMGSRPIPASEGLIEYTRHLQRENWRMKSEKTAQIIRNLPPIILPKKDEELENLQNELWKVKRDWEDLVCESVDIAFNPKLNDARKEYYMFLNEEKKGRVKVQMDALKDKINLLAAERKSSSITRADFKSFQKSGKESTEDIKLFTIGKNKENTEPPRKILLDKTQLRELYDKISNLI